MRNAVEDEVYLLSNADSVAPGRAYRTHVVKKTLQASGSTSDGAGAASVVVEVSNNHRDWLTAGTINLTLGTDLVSDGFEMNASWLWIRGRVASISGTDAAVSLVMGL